MESSSSVQYSVIIPVYNTFQALWELQHRLEQVFSTQIRQPYEIILVDDGSSNSKTWPMVENLVKQKPNISAVRLTRNFGQHAALLCGMAHAKGDFIITMDDDLQHLPEDIPTLTSRQEHDVVIGQFPIKEHSRARNLASSMKAYFDRVLSGKPKDLRISTFCLIRRNIVDQMLIIAQTSFPFFSSLIFYVTRDVIGVPVRHNPRQEGKSGYSTLKLVRLFSRLLINNSKIIFQVVAWCGALLFGMSLTFLVGLLFWNFSHQNVPNWLFMGLVVLASNGFLILALGILGISLAHTAAAVEQRKPYLIRQHIF